MPEVRILKATPEDADRVARLGGQVAAQPLFISYGVTADGLSTALRALALAQGGAGSHAETLLIAEAGDERARLCGFARFHHQGSLGMGGYLRLIALCPGFEGQGIGARLLRAVEEEVATRSAVLFLLTAEFNRGARRFYERHGYALAGTIPDLVREGIVEMLYFKRLRLSLREGA